MLVDRFCDDRRLAGRLRCIVGHGFRRERAEDIRDFVHPQATMERDGAQVVAVETTGELRQHGVLRVRRDALDDELVPRDPQRECRPSLEQMFGAAGDSDDRRLEGWVTLRIHRVLMQGDG